MADNKFPQNNNKETVKLRQSEFLLRPLPGVRQDRSASHRERAASPQASPVGNARRARRLDKNSDRTKKHSTRRQTVQAIGWIGRPISEEINRIAKESGLSRSRTIATLLEEAVHQRLHIRHAVMLAPLVKKAVVKADAVSDRHCLRQQPNPRAHRQCFSEITPSGGDGGDPSAYGKKSQRQHPAPAAPDYGACPDHSRVVCDA
jgi:hypothetical protein